MAKRKAPKRITKKAMKKMERATLHINDELPRIGPGRRIVLIRKLTKSTAQIIYNGQPMNVKRATFDLCRID